jgi:hypothetical protein
MFITREKADVIQQMSPYLIEKIPRDQFGIRMQLHCLPILEDGEATGSIVLVLPRLHPVHRALMDFAPIIANMFPDGAVLYMTDFERSTRYYASEKFQLPDLEEGKALKASEVARESMKTKQPVAREFDASVYGTPVLFMNFPLFDWEIKTKVVASLGLALPKERSVQLRHHSASIARSLEEISAVIEQLAASAGNINENEQKLNGNIKKINHHTGEITEVLSFIKQIADETKMLGLNAAIEAARAGEAGRGFGVVAEEIRKLSDESKQTVAKIRQLTDQINLEVQQTTEFSQANLNSSQEQAAATQEVNASIEEITSLSDELSKMAQDM